MRARILFLASLLLLAPFAAGDQGDGDSGSSGPGGGSDGGDHNETEPGNATHDDPDSNQTEDGNETHDGNETMGDSSGPGSGRDRASGLAEACRDSQRPRECAREYCRERDDDVCERVLEEFDRARPVRAALEMCRADRDVRACEALARLSAAQGQSRHISFEVDREGKALVEYAVDGRLLLQAIDYADDTEEFDVERHGSQLRFETDDSRLVVHDNPTGTFYFKSDDQELYLRFPESAVIQHTDRGARIDYGDYRALLVGDDFEAMDHTIVLYGDAMFHSPVGAPDPEVEEALEHGRMGGQVRVGGSGGSVVAFDDVNITIEGDTTATPDAPLRVTFDAALREGRTFVIDIGDDVLLGDELDLRYFDVHEDGNETEVVFRMADSLADVLDPGDDGGQPEYWIVEDADGVQVLVSVPHWSVHAIELASIGEFLVQPSVVVGVVAGVAGVGLAGVAMFWPRREDD